MDLAYLFTGIALGALFVGGLLWFYFKNRQGLNKREAEELMRLKQELEYKAKYDREKIEQQELELSSLEEELNVERGKVLHLSESLASKVADYKNLEIKLQEHKQEIEELQTKFSIQFKNLANEIFEEKSKKFTDQNKVNLLDVLNPLKERIQEFEKKVEQTNKESIDRNAALNAQITGLKELNLQITREAENLTKALKGESKTQGNWGEFILESILEKSGLTKDREYFIQESLQGADGRRLQPDVIVRLPEQRHLVIDSKVSLVAYERYISTTDEAEKSKFIIEHLASIKNHIKSLSSKNYQQLYDIEGLDFVLLFMPIEPAFGLAVQQDATLFNQAYESNIVIVSPSTLIATLRTIASIWRQEKQNRHALEIARQGGLLYDKFKSFVDDLIKVGDSLKLTKKNYDLAMNKLTDGKDNLIRKTERLKELGAKATKNQDQRLIDRALDK